MLSEKANWATLVAISDIVRNIGLVVVGCIGLMIAAWRSRAAVLQAKAALEQSELARRDHIAEIFNRATGQLGDEKLEVRLGAIFTLKELCADGRYSAYISPVIETLSVYMRVRTATVTTDSPAIDIEAIAELLRQHSSTGKEKTDVSAS